MDTSLLEGSRSPMFNESIARVLCNKWGELMEGVEREDKRKLLAQMYENQVSNFTDGKQNIFEQTKTTDIASWPKFIFPLLRRIYPNLIAPDLISVQPGRYSWAVSVVTC